MTDFTPIAEGLERAAEGARDPSGKTPLDDAFERFDLESNTIKSEFARFLADLLPSLVQKGALHLKLWRQLVRRSRTKDRDLATAIERLLGEADIRTDVDRRLWVSLALMDLGRPRSVASLRRDAELKTKYVGDWLALIAANDNYVDVKSAFIEAADAGIISIEQLCLKAEVIRRQFGDKLSDFLKSIVTVFKDKSEREVIVAAAQKMYGLDISEYAADNPGNIEGQATPTLEGWLDQKTFDLLNTVEEEASMREAA